MTFKEIQEDVIKKYRVTIEENSSCWGRMHAHVKTRKVCKWHPKNSANATFDLLHEIGHIETTKAGMRRMESELYATLWAIDRCRDYGIHITQKQWEVYRDYIERERDRGIRRGGTGYPEVVLPMDVIK